MVQHTIDSKTSEYGLSTTEAELSVHDIAAPNSVGSSSPSKDGIPNSNSPRVSGTKRPLSECQMIPPEHQPSNSSAGNGHLVYVRRKSEADVVRSITNDNANINADCQVSRIISQQEASTGPIFQNKEPMIHCIPAFAPFPMEAAAIPPGKPSVSLPYCKSDIRVAPAGSNYQPLASAASSLGSSKGLRNLHWEERFHQLQLLLRKLDQSEHEDYIKLLRSLSSVELSRHAVELEKKSIQLSLEEAKELKRVGVLNVLGKPTKPFKVPSTFQDRSEK
ncbi:hypothetical protein M0R45_009953 [Rubus argutus]|uniref:Uncharacterized protein n=1 Tax=Rubus argutus TaxID=59490 RepID=A0AAW1Y6A1_RUBAR